MTTSIKFDLGLPSLDYALSHVRPPATGPYWPALPQSPNLIKLGDAGNDPFYFKKLQKKSFCSEANAKFSLCYLRITYPDIEAILSKAEKYATSIG